MNEKLRHSTRRLSKITHVKRPLFMKLNGNSMPLKDLRPNWALKPEVGRVTLGSERKNRAPDLTR